MSFVEKAFKSGLVDFLCICSLVIIVLIIGIKIGNTTCEQQHANDLIQAGFTIVDPEGHEIREFD